MRINHRYNLGTHVTVHRFKATLIILTSAIKTGMIADTLMVTG